MGSGLACNITVGTWLVLPGAHTTHCGPRPFAPADQSFPGSCPFPEAFPPPGPGGRGHRHDPLSPSLQARENSLHGPGLTTLDSELPNEASTSPSSRHLFRFLVIELHTPSRAAIWEVEFPKLASGGRQPESENYQSQNTRREHRPWAAGSVGQCGSPNI